MLTTVTDLLNLFDLAVIGLDTFEGIQPDAPNHHIVGGQIAARRHGCGEAIGHGGPDLAAGTR